MRRRLLSFAAVLVMLTVLAAPAMAGGWASIKLDGPPPPPYIEVPWTVGFTVMQHDVTPRNVDHAYLEAVHRETGETVNADAVQDGAVGHYLVTATFPLAGEWKWSITAEPFQGSSFATLNVLSGAGAASAPAVSAQVATDVPHPAHIHSGSCSELGDVVYPLTDIGAPVMDEAATPVAASNGKGAETAVAVAVSVTTIDTMLFTLFSGPYAINVHESADNIDTYIACGDIGGQPSSSDLVIGLEPLNNSGMAGVAVIHGEGTKTTVTVYLFAVSSGAGAPSAATPSASIGTTAEIKLLATADGNWFFSPESIEIAAGTTVTWTNETDVAHTVSGSDLSFDDSGYIEPGQSFSQTFSDPGTYRFKCDPHPWMTGQIVMK